VGKLKTPVTFSKWQANHEELQRSQRGPRSCFEIAFIGIKGIEEREDELATELAAMAAVNLLSAKAPNSKARDRGFG
jgi:hypothetical protein